PFPTRRSSDLIGRAPHPRTLMGSGSKGSLGGEGHRLSPGSWRAATRRVNGVSAQKRYGGLSSSGNLPAPPPTETTENYAHSPGNAWAPSRRDAVEAQGRGGDERPFREAEAGPAVRIATGSAGPVGDVPPAEDQGRHAGERRPARLSANPASECAPFRPGAVPPRPWFGDPGSATLARRRGRRASRRSPAPRARRASSPAAIVSASRHHRRDQAERRPRALRCRDGRVRLAVAWLPDRGDAPARSWFTTRSNATSVLGPGSVTGTLRRPCPDGAAWLARVPGAQA